MDDVNSILLGAINALPADGSGTVVAPEPEDETSADAADAGASEQEPQGDAEQQEPAVESLGKPADAWRAIDDLLSREDASPEELKEARNALLAQRRKVGQNYRESEKKLRKANEARTMAKKELAAATLTNSQLSSAIHELQVGDAKQITAVLGKLTGKDGLKLLDEMMLQAATGKRPSPEIAELRAELDALKGAKDTERKQQELARAHQQRQSAEVAFLTIVNDEAKYPLLSSYAKSTPADTIAVADEIADSLRDELGRVATFQEVASRIERDLAALRGPADTGRTTGAPVVKSEPSRPAHRPMNRTRVAAPVAHQRSREEVIAELAQDKSLMSRLF